MNYEIIKTGSSGNAIVVEKKFLLDCGVPYKTIKPYLDDIKLVFISHSHVDHLNKATIKKIAYNYPNIVFLCGVGLYQTLKDIGLGSKQVYAINTGTWHNMGMCKVKLDFLYHDVPNSALSLIYKDKSLFYATDTSRLDHIIAYGYDLYLVEGNYETNEEMDLKIAEAKSKGKFTYLERAKNNHMEQVATLNWLDKNMAEHSKYTFIHQHIDKEKTNEII